MRFLKPSNKNLIDYEMVVVNKKQDKIIISNYIKFKSGSTRLVARYKEESWQIGDIEEMLLKLGYQYI